MFITYFLGLGLGRGRRSFGIFSGNMFIERKNTDQRNTFVIHFYENEIYCNETRILQTFNLNSISSEIIDEAPRSRPGEVLPALAILSTNSNLGSTAASTSRCEELKLVGHSHAMYAR